MPAPMREDVRVHGITSFIEGFWWLVFIVPPVVGGSLQKHHRRRLAILAAKGKLAETKSQSLSAPPEPQPICGCSHHLSFHNPHTSACAVDDCRCQQYVGPEPLGHVFALPLVDPDYSGNGAEVSPPPPHVSAADTPLNT
jgi:hypothetical protein